MGYHVIKMNPKLYKYVRAVGEARFGEDNSTPQLIYLMTRHLHKCNKRSM